MAIQNILVKIPLRSEDEMWIRIRESYETDSNPKPFGLNPS